MTKSAHGATALFIGLSLGLTQCEESEMEKMCRQICGGLSCGDGDISFCTRQCVDREDDAAKLGDGCSKANQVLVECLNALEPCTPLDNWKAQRGTDFDYPCRPETEAFLKACPGLWFEGPGP